MEHAKPVKKIRVGLVNIAIWANTTKEGKPYSTVSVERSYKVKDAWKSTPSLRQSDLPGAILALNEAYKYLALSSPEETAHDATPDTAQDI